MLRSGQKDTENPSPRCEIPEEEDTLLRKAFGRHGGMLADRKAAAEVVAKYQGEGSGKGFLLQLSGLHGEIAGPLPHGRTRLVRHPGWPQHTEICDFFLSEGAMEACEQLPRPTSSERLQVSRRLPR
jgi:hypothetical protein